MKVDDIDKKKIILTGPPNTGKTTINKIYFELANPIRLIEDTLEPTKGVESSVYSLFQNSISIYDLAGQENELWFSTEKHIFNNSSIILCIFDIKNSLRKIFEFLVNILKVRQLLDLFECKIIILLHKVDLVRKSYLINKNRAIKRIFKVKFPEYANLPIYHTSIVKKYFLKTYYVMLDVFNFCFLQDLIPIQKDLFATIKTDLSIILQIDDSITYSWNVLKDKFNLELAQALTHLERLANLNLINIHSLNPFTFNLTDRARIFKRGLKNEITKVEESRFSKSVELYYTFLNLKKHSNYS